MKGVAYATPLLFTGRGLLFCCIIAMKVKGPAVQHSDYGDTALPDRRTLRGAVPISHAGIRAWLTNRAVIACVLGFLTVILLTATAPALGLTWDEPAYIVAAQSYVE